MRSTIDQDHARDCQAAAQHYAEVAQEDRPKALLNLRMVQQRAITAGVAVPLSTQPQQPGQHVWETEVQILGFDIPMTVRFDARRRYGDRTEITVCSVLLRNVEILPAFNRDELREIEDECRWRVE